MPPPPSPTHPSSSLHPLVSIQTPSIEGIRLDWGWRRVGLEWLREGGGSVLNGSDRGIGGSCFEGSWPVLEGG